MSGGFHNREEFTELTAAELLWVQTGSAGILLLKEQSSAPAATPGYGKIYVKTDNLLYYLNDSGVEVQIGAGATGTQVWSEAVTFSGAIGTLAHTPTAGTLRLYRGGARQQAGGGNDYTLAVATITLSTAADPAEVFVADYTY